ncbi:MAG: AI-2E family transporter [Candidatus Methanoperedens sp.]|nr:AI-2E family transporter [Candidatus Methanoperedens sp.]
MSLSSKLHSRSHPAIFLVALGVAVIMISPFITPLLIAAITTYILRPIVKKLGSDKLLSRVAIASLIFVIALPLAFLFSYVSTNVGQIPGDIIGLGDKLTAIISSFSEQISDAGMGTYTNLPVGASEITASLTSFGLGIASDLMTSIPMLLLDFVIYLYATYYFMSYGHKAVDSIRSYASTLQKEDEQFISSIMKGLKKSFDVLVMSYVTMSFIVFVLSLIGYYIFGVPHAFVLAVLTGLFGFLPVFGTWMVYVPAAAYMYYIGNTFSAIGVLVFGIAVLTIFLPMFLQPYLGSKQSDVSPLTIFLGFFSGPIIFGAKGILLGPIILVVVNTIIYEYMEFRIENEKNALDYD